MNAASARRAGAVLVAVLGALLVSACAAFPARGPVVPAERIESARTSLQLSAARPTAGDSPAGIVRGFLNAGLDSHVDHTVAREYLTSAASRKWQAQAPVVVKDGSLKVEQIRGDSTDPRARTTTTTPADGAVATVRVTGLVTARVDEHGLLALPSADGGSPGGPVLSRDIDLIAAKGQWRISTPPPGLILTQSGFERSFLSLPLYFPDVTNTWLVPDVRWFPHPDDEDLSPTAPLAVSALLAGPASWLGPPDGAVATGAVAGTTLTNVGPVQIADGVVSVDLTKEARSIPPARLLLLRAQILATLQGLPPQGLTTVSDVVLTALQVKLDVRPGLAPARWTSPVVNTLCVTPRGAVGRIVPGAKGNPGCQVRDDLAALTGPGLRLPTADSAGGAVAALAAGDSLVVAATPEGKQVTVLTGAGLTQPSIDARHWIWASPGTSTGVLLAGAVGQAPRKVAAPWLAGQRVLSVRISPEGARALVLVQRRDGAQALIAGVVRDRAGGPLRLTDKPLSVLPGLTRAVDAGWSGTDEIVVLGTCAGDRGTYVWRVTVGGQAAHLIEQALPDPVTGLAVSAGDVRDVYVRGPGGKAYVSSLGAWRQIAVKDPTLPG